MYSRSACRSFLLCCAAVALASVSAEPELAVASISAESEPSREQTANRNRVLVKIYSKGGSKDDVADAVKELVVGALPAIAEGDVSSEVIEKHSTGAYRRMGASGASACPEDSSSFYTVMAFDVSTPESSSELEKYLWSTDIAAAINSAKPDLCTAKVIPAKRGAKFTVLRAVAPKAEGSRGRRESKYSGKRPGSSSTHALEGHHHSPGHIGLNRTHVGSLSGKAAAAGEGRHATAHHHSQGHAHEGQNESKDEQSETNPHPSSGHHNSDKTGSHHPVGKQQGKTHGTKRPFAHGAQDSTAEVVDKDAADEAEVAATVNDETVNGAAEAPEKEADADEEQAAEDEATEGEQVDAEGGNEADDKGQEEADTVTNTADDEAASPADEQAQEEAADAATAPEEAGEPEEEAVEEPEEDVADDKPEEEVEAKEEEVAEEPAAEEETKEEENEEEKAEEEEGVMAVEEPKEEKEPGEKGQDEEEGTDVAETKDAGEDAATGEGLQMEDVQEEAAGEAARH